MFPTFDVPPQHSETVGARKARRAKEEETARRSSSATSRSSGSTRSAANSSEPRTHERSGFGWFGTSKKGIQEISALPATKKQNVLPNSMLEPESKTKAVQSQQDVDRRQSNQTGKDDQSLGPQNLSSPLLESFPSPPPVGALPLPPSTGLLSLPERRSQYSTTSSDRTTSSNRSAFTQASSYDGTPPEFASSMHLEPVAPRTGSRQSDHSAKVAQGPFARALTKMESAGSRIISTRLSEEWEGLDDDESYQEVVFEKRLWALTAYQRLTQNKQLQSPAHEILTNSTPAHQRRILHLHGSLADGWVLAARYPAATVYTLSSLKSSNLPTTHPAPLNHHSLYTPNLSSATPFPDSYFDAIVSRSIATVLRNDDWARSFFDCMRVLKPRGQIEMLSVDAHMSCEGPKLCSWVDEHISCRLEAHGLSKQASDTVLDTMEIVGLENIRRARVALPAHSPKAAAMASPPALSPQDALDTSKMMALLGKHFYQDLYKNFVHSTAGEEWFWSRKDIRDECERYNTKMVLTIACAVKPSAAAHSYLDI